MRMTMYRIFDTETNDYISIGSSGKSYFDSIKNARNAHHYIGKNKARYKIHLFMCTLLDDNADPMTDEEWIKYNKEKDRDSKYCEWQKNNPYKTWWNYQMENLVEDMIEESLRKD